MATFSGPITTARRQPDGGLWFPKAATGVTVYKTAEGTWGAGQWLDDSFLATCLRVYRGGYTYTVDATEGDELDAAGYGAYITPTAIYDDVNVQYDNPTIQFDEY